MTLKYTLLVLFISQIVMSNANGQPLERIGAIQFEPHISDADSFGGTDVWGWTGPGGTEYAIMGIASGIAIVNTNLMEVDSILPGPNEHLLFFHRDIKTYRHYAYVVSDKNGFNQGLMVIDLQYLPDSVVFIGSFPIDDTDGIRSHNMSIDTSTGFAYVEGQGEGIGANVLSIIDLTNPENPTFVTQFPNDGIRIHDLYARNDTLYIAEPINQSFSIWNVTNKFSPQLLVRKNIPDAGFVHNVWPTDDGKYLLTTEEDSGKSVKIWDISDLVSDSITIESEWLGASQLAHNVHVMGDFAFVSHYASGAHILDISDPQNIHEIASYDSYTQHDSSNGRGAWGIYPYTQNGTVFVSNIEGRLDVLAFDPEAIETDIEEPPLPKRSLFLSNYPNPFNPSTTIEFYLPRSGEVNLSIYNVNGRLVQVIFDGELNAGNYSRIWSGANATSGVYFYQLQTNDFVTTGKMVLVK